MPIVPRVDNFQVGQTAAPFVPARDGGSEQLAAVAGKPAEALGAGMQRVGDAVSDIAAQMQRRADLTQINAAENEAIQKRLELTFNPQTGYKNLKGNDALQRPSGQALGDEYGDKFKSALDDISSRLGTEEQKRIFAMRANDMLTSFRGDVDGHMLTEFRNHEFSTQDGIIKLASDDAKLNWNDQSLDPTRNKITSAIGRAQSAVYQMGKVQGWAASDVESKLHDVTSGIHMGVIEAALQNNNPEYALQYLQTNKAGMTANDLLKVQGVINTDVKARLSDGIATNVGAAMRAQVQPPDIERAFNVAIQKESGGQQFDGNGQPLTSPKGAIGIAQMMPSTAPEAAKLAGLPWDENRYKTDPEYNKALGRAYFVQKVKEFDGDISKAYAAYNAGADNVKKAVADATKAGNPAGWLEAMAKYQSVDNHKETVDYVSKNVQAFNAGAVMATRTTLQDWHDEARARVKQRYGDTPPAGMLKMTLDATTKQFEDFNKDLTAKGENAVAQFQQAVIANNGDFTKVPITLRQAVTQYAPGKMDDLMKFADSIRKGPEVKTDMAAYNWALTYPEKLAKMPDPDFLHFVRTNFSPTDQEKIVKVRTSEINGDDSSSQSIMQRELNRVVDERMTNIGIMPPTEKTPKEDRQQYGAVRRYLQDYVQSLQDSQNKKLTPKELREAADRVFQDRTFRNVYLGFIRGPETTEHLMSMKPDDLPPEDLAQTKKTLAAIGNIKPTDGDIMRMYWRKKNGR